MPDRKIDLVITPVLNIHNDEILKSIGVKSLDINIENISNRSIDFDIEMKVYKKSGFKLISETDLKSALTENTRSNYFDIGTVAAYSFTIDLEEYDDFIIISRTKLRHQKTAVNIEQNKLETNIFNQYLCVAEENPNLINGEISIRSDEFSEGLFVKTFEIKDEK